MTKEISGTWMEIVAFSNRCLQSLAQKGKKPRVEQRITAAFFVSADERKVVKTTVIWQSKTPRCFWLVSTTNKLTEVSYFYDSKSWMQVEIEEKVLDTFNFQMKKERRNVILFLDNATGPSNFIDWHV